MTVITGELKVHEVEESEVPFTLDKLLEVRKELQPFRKEFTKMLDELKKSGATFDLMGETGEYIKGKMPQYDISATIEYDTEMLPDPLVMFKVYNTNDFTILDPVWASMVQEKASSVFRNKLLDYVIGEAPGKNTEAVQPEEEE